MKKFNYTFILCALFMTSCATQQFVSSVEGDEIQRLNKFDHLIEIENFSKKLFKSSSNKYSQYIATIKCYLK